ncbi:MAG: hypothetical protein E6R13_09810 [Spirochaetes bacterium]|nr:MAG: hypothetical protein E6R13_09810 [Spirochaetota bacterium]
MSGLKKGSKQTGGIDSTNLKVIKYYNDRFEDNNKKANQPRVEVMQEFFPNGKAPKKCKKC